jgi:hypothetical protein
MVTLSVISVVNRLRLTAWITCGLPRLAGDVLRNIAASGSARNNSTGSSSLISSIDLFLFELQIF